MRPVDARLEDRVSRVRGELERSLEELLGLGELGLVDERVREQHGEADALDRVVAPLRGVERLAEDRVGRIEVVEHRVRAAERVRPGRVIGEVVRHDAPRLLEPAHRLAGVPLAERELAEPRERPGPLVGVGALLERRLEHLPRLVGLVEAQRELCVHEPRRGVVPLRAGGEVVLADAETPAHLAQELEGRDPVARLDPRDVRGRAARKRELALAQAGALTGLSQPLTDRDGIIYMS